MRSGSGLLSARNGLSLIEVIIAMGILVGTTAVLAQLIGIGEKQANRAADMTEAQTLCHNKMAELLAGLTPFTSCEATPIDLESSWDYQVQIAPVGFRDVYSVTVMVFERQLDVVAPIEFQSTTPQKRSFRLCRWVSESDLPETGTTSILEPF